MFSINGTISLGDVVAFTQYSRQFTQPIVQTANIVNILQSTAASAERVFEILDAAEEEPDAPDAVELANPEGRVSFQHVRFGYREDKILISDMNIDVKPGQTVAIVGPTGAGKTTLVNLIMRFYDVDAGAILVDGVDAAGAPFRERDIREITRSSLRRRIGMVLQDTWLFGGTVRENIAYAQPDATEEEVVAAAKAAHAHSFIKRLPQGYDTVLDTAGGSLSAGQRQLLTIARAMLSDPDILVLDEATSSIDTLTEQRVTRAFAKLARGRTSFVIAHRLSTIRDADLIIVMNEGHVVEQGNHRELLEKGGFYARLYQSQFAAAE